MNGSALSEAIDAVVSWFKARGFGSGRDLSAVLEELIKEVKSA